MGASGPDDGVPVPRRRDGLLALTILGVLAAVVLAALGTWQVERRAWKLDLIARVEARVRAAPVPAPGPADWPGLTAAADAYRRVRVEGRYLPGPPTLVQAVTELGGGFWALALLRAADGSVVLVNRGFVPTDRRDPATWPPPPEPVAVTGLLRMSEPGGAFLRSNDPPTHRWYSRDVAAIASARGLGTVAPYFIDADASPDATALPVGGLTVVAFRNDHLVYAITWYVLTAMVAAGVVYANLDGARARRSPSRPAREPVVPPS